MPENITSTSSKYNAHAVRSGPRGAFGSLVLALLLLAVPALFGQVTPPSPAATAAHATITSYNGPATCVACHQQQAMNMFGSVHYQEMGETPDVPNITGQAGKGSNGGRVMNSYCGTPSTSSRATCATCHVGNGRIPSTTLTTEQLNNIDCLMCHQDAYKRVPAGPFTTLTMPGTNGTTHTIQVAVEDATGFDFVPDTAKMTISILQAAQTVHLPTRASCLRCHAGAGGSDGGKRGDMSTLSANPTATSDFHMSPQGGNMSCSACHSDGTHHFAGRGVDLRPTDSAVEATCQNCHTDRPHADYSARTGTARDVHAGRVACQSCHIPRYAKEKSTEMTRDWLTAHFSLTACRGQGGWVPSETRASNVVPSYRWYDGTSIANVLSQVPVQGANGEYILASPNGSVQSPGAKLFPMKIHDSNSARQDATGLLVPHSTFSYFTSGDFAQAIAEGQQLSGLEGPVSIVKVREFQTINHGVEGSTNALQCGACHSSYSAGGPVRMNLKADLGYALKGPESTVCIQCHGTKSNPGFASVHDRHVRSKGYDCSNCHTFSRATERGLLTVQGFRPAAPGGPAVETVSTTSLKVVWADNSSTEQGFRIQRSTDGVNFAQVASVGAGVTSYNDSALTGARPYYYRVVAYNAVGTSDLSQVGRGNTASTTSPSLPAAPSGLTVTAASASQVQLAWTDNANNETGFQVERSTDGVNFTLVTTVAAGVTSFSNTGLSGGTRYYYRVRAVNSTGASAYSNVASVTTPAVVVPPAAPTGLAATAGDRRVTLTWNASTGSTSYNVKRATSAGGTFTVIASGVTALTYSDTSVANGTTYYYVVSAVNSAGESADSATVSATPVAPVVTPNAPTGLTATAGDRRVTLTWNASTGATSYNVKRATSAGGAFTVIASGVTALTYGDTSVANGTTYYYAVSAVNSGGESANSTTVSATPVAPVVPPNPPTGLAATTGDRRVTLNWNASTGASSYNVKRATSAGGTFTVIASGVTALTYSDTSVANGTTYYYVVSAVNSGGESINSATVSATPRAPGVVNPPQELRASSGGEPWIALAWKQSTSQGIAQNRIYRSTSSSGSYTAIATIPAAEAFRDQTVLSGVTYYYVVTAIDSYGQESAFSNRARRRANFRSQTP
jgi:fibronectin type 3 domain-containing protein